MERRDEKKVSEKDLLPEAIAVADYIIKLLPPSIREHHELGKLEGDTIYLNRIKPSPECDSCDKKGGHHRRNIMIKCYQGGLIKYKCINKFDKLNKRQI